MAKQCASEKMRFRSRGDAENYVRAVKKSGDPQFTVRNVYPCDECRGWHMTSKGRHSFNLKPVDSYVSMEVIKSYAFELRVQQVPEPDRMIRPKLSSDRLLELELAILERKLSEKKCGQ